MTAALTLFVQDGTPFPKLPASKKAYKPRVALIKKIETAYRPLLGLTQGRHSTRVGEFLEMAPKYVDSWLTGDAFKLPRDFRKPDYPLALLSDTMGPVPVVTTDKDFDRVRLHPKNCSLCQKSFGLLNKARFCRVCHSAHCKKCLQEVWLPKVLDTVSVCHNCMSDATLNEK